MPKKRFSAKQIVGALRRIEVLTSQGKSTRAACREAGVSQQNYYRWRNEYFELELDRAKQMKRLERENIHLKRLIADLSLEKSIASGNLQIQSGADRLLHTFGGRMACRTPARSLANRAERNDHVRAGR